MTKNYQKFWFGLALGTLAGLLVTQNSFNKRRMPNARIWQPILNEKMDPIEAATLMARVQQRYAELINQGVTFKNKALQFHLNQVILPGLAYYQTLRSDGLTQETALAEVDALFEAQYTIGFVNFLRSNRLLDRIPGGFPTFKRLIRVVMQYGFPSPVWELEYIPEDEQHFGFNIHRCFYLDMLTYFGAPELTPSFCKVDHISMTTLPEEIHWERSSTLGMGATHCDFRWEYIPLAEGK